MYCKKVNLDFSNVDLSHIGDPLFIFDEGQKYKKGIEPHTVVPLNVFKIHDKLKDECLQNFPRAILEIEVPDIFMIDVNCPDVFNPKISPHIDYKRKCALNFYIHTNREKTNFYSWNRKEEICVELDSFCANNNECWLLDTSKIHSVDLIPLTRRTALSFSFSKISFKDLSELIDEAS